MNGWILFGIGLVSLAIIGFALAYLGLKGWRLAKHGVGVSRHIAPLAAELAGRADEAGRAARAALHGRRGPRRQPRTHAAFAAAPADHHGRLGRRLAPLVRIAEYLGT